ncbi:hypothetical protein Scep_001243 [Stephania cephalantha]|uniref:Uncharacterized protein n=1 Tax=Stephania cephalantha TaxID=152367 RepID=A0AAP0L926_9MAGN
MGDVDGGRPRPIGWGGCECAFTKRRLFGEGPRYPGERRIDPAELLAPLRQWELSKASHHPRPLLTERKKREKKRERESNWKREKEIEGRETTREGDGGESSGAVQRTRTSSGAVEQQRRRGEATPGAAVAGRRQRRRGCARRLRGGDDAGWQASQQPAATTPAVAERAARGSGAGGRGSDACGGDVRRRLTAMTRDSDARRDNSGGAGGVAGSGAVARCRNNRSSANILSGFTHLGFVIVFGDKSRDLTDNAEAKES